MSGVNAWHCHTDAILPNVDEALHCTMVLAD